MSMLAKLTFKSVQRVVKADPVVVRRNKLMAAIEEQGRVLDAELAGRQYAVPVTRVKKEENGARVKVAAEKTVRAWYFAQDAGWYVQCKYGVRVLTLSDKGNAVWVKEQKDVKGVLEALYAAAAAGELDAALTGLTGKSKAK
jgi:hypothetical protein